MGMRFKNIIILSKLFILIGCSNLQWPPHDNSISDGYHEKRSNFSSPEVRDFIDLPAYGIVRVKKGETVFTLSRRYGVSSQKIIDKNNLKPPYRLRSGASLIIPKPRSHLIKKGDSLYKISRQFGVNVYELARLNRLKKPFRIFAGQKLVLPPLDSSDPIDDTSRSIIGDNSFLKNESPKSGPSVKSPQKNELIFNKYTFKPKKSKANSKKPKSIKIPRIKTSGRFNWPLRGRLSSIYGPKGKGLHNDGINILAPRGTSVRAASNGVVAYAGNELRGFGNLLLIKHSEGWVTAYAHNEKLLVRRGDKVNKGEIIAKVGASGNVVLPQLHFEVRKGKRAINPLKHLKRLDAGMTDIFKEVL